MITLLRKLFMKNYTDTKNPTVRQQYGILCGFLGIFLNIILFFGKLFAGMISNSISITADAFNNLSDAGSSVITLIGFKLSAQKPDPEHPFGHGRIEYLSGFLVSVTIIIMAVELLKTSVDKITNPSTLEFSPFILVILIVSILTKLYMATYNTRIAKEIASTAMKATATDSLSDCIATFVVLSVTLISHFTKSTLPLDGICGLFVGLFILYSGYQAAKDTISPLLGQAPPPEFVAQIETMVASYPEIIGIHDLVVHDYGPGRLMISLHAEVPANGDVLSLHDTIDNLEKQLKQELNCSATIHMDPIRNNDPETMALKACVQNLLKEIDATLTLHDFRIVAGPTHTNILFDVVVPFSSVIEDKKLTDLLSSQITAINENYFAIIQIDRAYLN